MVHHGTERHSAKKRRWRPGTQALREIRKSQKGVGLLMPRRPFRRFVRNIIQDTSYNHVSRITQSAAEALQEASEGYLIDLFTDSMHAVVHRRRRTLTPKDMELVNKIREKRPKQEETSVFFASTPEMRKKNKVAIIKRHRVVTAPLVKKSPKKSPRRRTVFGPKRPPGYVVKAIVNHRVHPETDGLEFLTEWKGYPPDQASWQPIDDFIEGKKMTKLLKSYCETHNLDCGTYH